MAAPERITRDKLEKRFGTVDVFSLLEVTYKTAEENMKRNYRKLSLKYHPDKHR